LTAQILDRVLTCYRIGDPSGAYPIFDPTGSKLSPGRWNTAQCPVIYTSEHYSTAMLEKLVHGSGAVPPNQHYIEITIPNGVSYEILNAANLPDWAHATPTASKTYGDDWQRTKRSLLLIVPSVVARVEKKFLINPDHPQFGQLRASMHQPIWWDDRLFS
jgi:RES domain-containing protein